MRSSRLLSLSSRRSIRCLSTTVNTDPKQIWKEMQPRLVLRSVRWRDQLVKDVVARKLVPLPDKKLQGYKWAIIDGEDNRFHAIFSNIAVQPWYLAGCGFTCLADIKNLYTDCLKPYGIEFSSETFRGNPFWDYMFYPSIHPEEDNATSEFFRSILSSYIEGTPECKQREEFLKGVAELKQPNEKYSQKQIDHAKKLLHTPLEKQLSFYQNQFLNWLPLHYYSNEKPYPKGF